MWLFGERAATTHTRTRTHTSLAPELSFSAPPRSATSSMLMEALQLQDPGHSWLVSPVLRALGTVPGAWLPPELSCIARQDGVRGSGELVITRMAGTWSREELEVARCCGEGAAVLWEDGGELMSREEEHSSAPTQEVAGW